MTKFSLTIESDQSGSIAYVAELADLFINGSGAKIQPFEIKLIFDWLIDKFGDYIWECRDWDEEEAKLLKEVLGTIAKFTNDIGCYAPWDGSAEP